MKIEIPLQDNQHVELTKKGDGHISLKAKDAKENQVEMVLSMSDAKTLTDALKII